MRYGKWSRSRVIGRRQTSSAPEPPPSPVIQACSNVTRSEGRTIGPSFDDCAPSSPTPRQCLPRDRRGPSFRVFRETAMRTVTVIGCDIGPAVATWR